MTNRAATGGTGVIPIGSEGDGNDIAGPDNHIGYDPFMTAATWFMGKSKYQPAAAG